MPPSPSEAVARAIASMPRDGSITDFATHFQNSLVQQGFEIVARAPFRKECLELAVRCGIPMATPGELTAAAVEFARFIGDLPSPAANHSEDQEEVFTFGADVTHRGITVDLGDASVTVGMERLVREFRRSLNRIVDAQRGAGRAS